MKAFKKPLAAAIGAAVIGSLAATGASAAENPFGMSELSSGYTQMAEGKCGAGKAKAATEGKCGAGKAMKAEGKCGEGKCGGKK